MNKINIGNLVSNVTNMNDYLKNLAKNNKTKQTKSQDTYFKYNLHKCLKTNFHEIDIQENDHINFCCFRITESTKYVQVLYPYLEYLLYKYPDNKKKESNLCLFPFIEYKKDMKILNESKKFIKSIFKKQYNCLGYLIENDEVYLFYDIETKNLDSRILLSKKQKFWWTLIDEICNNKKILNFSIHSSVTSLFLKNPTLIYLKNKKDKNIEIPIVVYKGDFFDFIPYLYIIGQKSTTSAPFGPFYYFTNFLGSFRRASWSTNYKKIKVNNKLITDENGKYKKGGIIRYLVFLKNSRVMLNDKRDELKKGLIDDIEEIGTFKKNKYIGKWAKTYDSLYLNKIQLNNEVYHNMHPIIVLKNLENIRALTIHEIDMDSLKTNWDPLYTGYDIL